MQTNPEDNSLKTGSLQPQTNEELDLLALVSLIWAGKWTIAVTVSATICIALGYFYLSPPVFQATAKLTPPDSADVAPFNALGPARPGRSVSSVDAFSLGVTSLQRTISQIRNSELNNDSFPDFDGARFTLSLQKSPKNMPLKQLFSAKLTVTHSNPSRARELAHEVVQIANRRAIILLKEDIDAVAKAQIQSKKLEIDSLSRLETDTQASQLVTLQTKLELENLERIVSNDYSSTSTMALANPIALPGKRQRHSLVVLLALGLAGGSGLGAALVLFRSQKK